ncbi:sensor histidine kinase [Nocardiopsis sp. NPDC050513]|uniref:sensor histidine kinase n=1 Tax=Nocardiopsis sp. NPDC050513 TaxID=3364338 RepID=UPI0037BC1AFC
MPKIRRTRRGALKAACGSSPDEYAWPSGRADLPRGGADGTGGPRPVSAPARHWTAPDPRAGATRRRFAADAAVAAAHLLVFGAPVLDRAGTAVGTWAALSLLGAVSAGILLRWRWPARSFAVVLVVSLAGLGTGWSSDPLTAAAWTLYPLALTSSAGAARPRHAACLLGGVVLAASIGPAGAGPAVLTDLLRAAVVGSILLGGAWLLGRSVHERRIQEEHALAAATREAEASERLRVAREVHDVVSHTLGAVGMRAGVARYTGGDDPDSLRAALSDIEAATRAASDELRRLLGGLRAPDDAPLAPQPGLADLPDLAATARGAGITCHLRVDGAEDVPPNTAASVHRVVQESLTNAVRHAPGTTCDITVTVVADGGGHVVDVVVADTGPAGDHRPAPGSGTGLVGMRERVTAHGGALATGPHPDGGYRVHARIPFGG